jgi:hypothetical protein
MSGMSLTLFKYLCKNITCADTARRCVLWANEYNQIDPDSVKAIRNLARLYLNEQNTSELITLTANGDNYIPVIKNSALKNKLTVVEHNKRRFLCNKEILRVKKVTKYR